MSVSESFRAVREFQDLRKKTSARGDVGDSVTALVKAPRGYKLITGIVVRYRSDAGRYVLDTSGQEWSVDSSDVRKYVPVTEEDTAHENYLTIEHFSMLRGNQIHNSRSIGASVAILTKDEEKNPVIKYGLISSAFHANNGSCYSVTHRDGTVTDYINHDHVAGI